MTKTAAVTCALLLSVAACDDNGTDDDAGTGVDATTPMADAGRDGGSTTVDSGPPDPCRASMDDAISSVGCNDGLYGPTPMENEIGGSCTPDGEDGPGTCTAVAGLQAVCVADETDPTAGTCLYLCPTSGSYVSSGSCPSGSRCFTLDTDFALCFRDCNTADDCFEGEECDGEGSCVSGEPPPPIDGGVADGGVTEDGGPALLDGALPLPDAGI